MAYKTPRDLPCFTFWPRLLLLFSVHSVPSRGPLLFIGYTRCAPASGFVHWLFFLPQTLSSTAFTLLPSDLKCHLLHEGVHSSADILDFTLLMTLLIYLLYWLTNCDPSLKNKLSEGRDFCLFEYSFISSLANWLDGRRDGMNNFFEWII